MTPAVDVSGFFAARKRCVRYKERSQNMYGIILCTNTYTTKSSHIIDIGGHSNTHYMKLSLISILDVSRYTPLLNCSHEEDWSQMVDPKNQKL